MTRGARLKFVINKLNYNYNSFAEAIGVTRPTIYDMAEEVVMKTGKVREVTNDVIRKIKETFPQVNEDFLKGESQEWIVETPVESELVKIITDLRKEIERLNNTIEDLNDKLAGLENDKDFMDEIKDFMKDQRESLKKRGVI